MDPIMHNEDSLGDRSVMPSRQQLQVQQQAFTGNSSGMQAQQSFGGGRPQSFTNNSGGGGGPQQFGFNAAAAHLSNSIMPGTMSGEQARRIVPITTSVVPLPQFLSEKYILLLNHVVSQMHKISGTDNVGMLHDSFINYRLFEAYPVLLYIAAHKAFKHHPYIVSTSNTKWMDFSLFRNVFNPNVFQKTEQSINCELNRPYIQARTNTRLSSIKRIRLMDPDEESETSLQSRLKTSHETPEVVDLAYYATLYNTAKEILASETSTSWERNIASMLPKIVIDSSMYTLYAEYKKMLAIAIQDHPMMRLPQFQTWRSIFNLGNIMSTLMPANLALYNATSVVKSLKKHDKHGSAAMYTGMQIRLPIPVLCLLKVQRHKVRNDHQCFAQDIYDLMDSVSASLGLTRSYMLELGQPKNDRTLHVLTRSRDVSLKAQPGQLEDVPGYEFAMIINDSINVFAQANNELNSRLYTNLIYRLDGQDLLYTEELANLKQDESFERDQKIALLKWEYKCIKHNLPFESVDWQGDVENVESYLRRLRMWQQLCKDDELRKLVLEQVSYSIRYLQNQQNPVLYPLNFEATDIYEQPSAEMVEEILQQLTIRRQTEAMTQQNAANSQTTQDTANSQATQDAANPNQKTGHQAADADANASDASDLATNADVSVDESTSESSSSSALIIADV